MTTFDQIKTKHLVLALALGWFGACAGGGPASDTQPSAAPGAVDVEVVADRLLVTPSASADLEHLQRAMDDAGFRVASVTPEETLIIECEPARRAELEAIVGGSGSVRAVEVVRAAAELVPMEQRASVPREVLQGTEREADLLSSEALRAELQALRETPETLRMRRSARRKLDLALAAAPQNRALAALAPDAAFPSSIDNSTSQYFPPIGDQGLLGSCASWAVGYYYHSYVNAKRQGVAIKQHNANIECNPLFIYFLSNKGSDNGSTLSTAIEMLRYHGCAPYSSYTNTANAVQAPTLADYRAAMQTTMTRPALSHVAFKRAPTMSADLIQYNWDLINLFRARINAGEVIPVGVDFDLRLSRFPQFSYDGVISDTVGAVSSAHALTIVGYDDNKVYRDTATGATMRGAFLLANQWGGKGAVTNGSGEKGYVWYGYSGLANGRTSMFTSLHSAEIRPSRAVGVVQARKTDTLSNVTNLANDLVQLASSGYPASSVTSVAIDLTEFDYALTPGVYGARIFSSISGLANRDGLAIDGNTTWTIHDYGSQSIGTGRLYEYGLRITPSPLEQTWITSDGGYTGARSLSVSVDIHAGQRERVGSIFAALLHGGAFYLVTADGSVRPLASAGDPPAIFTGTLASSHTLNIFRDADLRAFVDGQLFVGYGVGATTRLALDEMLAASRYKALPWSVARDPALTVTDVRGGITARTFSLAVEPFEGYATVDTSLFVWAEINGTTFFNVGPGDWRVVAPGQELALRVGMPAGQQTILLQAAGDLSPFVGAKVYAGLGRPLGGLSAFAAMKERGIWKQVYELTP